MKLLTDEWSEIILRQRTIGLNCAKNVTFNQNQCPAVLPYTRVKRLSFFSLPSSQNSIAHGDFCVFMQFMDTNGLDMSCLNAMQNCCKETAFLVGNAHEVFALRTSVYVCVCVSECVACVNTTSLCPNQLGPL